MALLMASKCPVDLAKKPASCTAAAVPSTSPRRPAQELNHDQDEDGVRGNREQEWLALVLRLSLFVVGLVLRSFASCNSSAAWPVDLY